MKYLLTYQGIMLTYFLVFIINQISLLFVVLYCKNTENCPKAKSTIDGSTAAALYLM
jgi:hypothetical protein